MNESRNSGMVGSGRLSVVPNLFTLLNLLFGCMAIAFCFQQQILFTYSEYGEFGQTFLPENLCYASLCIGIAAVIDFLDGFVARLLKASSPLGAQLDSLADVVSFGVAPGMIVYQFLRASFAQDQQALEISMLWLLPAFIIPCAGAYRLGRFNIDTEQSYGFKGVPIPAAGLLIASFPLIYWYSGNETLIKLFSNEWFWYGVILVVSYLMVSTLPMLALKFKNASVKTLMPFIILAVIALITAVLLGWMAVPVTFAAYVIISLIYKQNQYDL
jgi:CDP-diacylglycerol---serine O-phosphatidyltransferase